MENKVVPNGENYLILPNYDEIEKVREFIDDALEQSEASTADCLSALCVMTVEIAYNAKINKPQLLNQVSHLWEIFDKQVEKREE
jgi:hypothetical protein